MATNPDRASYFPAIEKKHGQPMSYWFDQLAELEDAKYPEQIAFLRENHGFSQAHANALVMYCRGSKSSRRFESLDEYLESCSQTAQGTVRAILAAIAEEYPDLDPVIAWNQPMLQYRGAYVFGLSVHTKHILVAPFRSDVIDELRPRLADYKVNKKTVQVPIDWSVDAALLQDMVGACIAQVER
ncbi:MAG: DUF4287 domain-containing protein [Candidatus Nanopelagicales bacterium]